MDKLKFLELLELLPSELIQVGDILNVDLYTNNGVLLMASGQQITKENLYRLLAQDIFVLSPLQEDLQKNIKEESPPKAPPHPPISPDPLDFYDLIDSDPFADVKTPYALASSFYKEMVEVYSEIYRSESVQIKEYLQVEKTAYQIVAELLLKGDYYFNFNALRATDNYTEIHSVNVTLLSALIGKALGYKSECLHELVIAAFLHDLGRKRIPWILLNKPGVLTPQEFEYIKKHVNYEFTSLSAKIPNCVKRVIEQHHERWDGSGYVKGLKENQIHPFAQIVAVADVFDSLVTDRHHRKAYSLSDAYEVILLGSGLEFNPKVVQAFKSVITLYPVGSTVVLNTGETGKVIQAAAKFPTRPQVRLLFDTRGKYIQDYVIKDLQECHTLFIRNVKYPTD